VSHCSELSQLHQQPVGAVLRPFFIRKLCYKLQSIVTFTFIQNLIKILSSLLNGAMLTGSVTRIFKIRVIFGVWFERQKVDKKANLHEN